MVRCSKIIGNEIKMYDDIHTITPGTETLVMDDSIRHGSNILIGLLDRALTIPAVAGVVGIPEAILNRADDIPEYAVVLADIRRSGGK